MTSILLHPWCHIYSFAGIVYLWCSSHAQLRMWEVLVFFPTRLLTSPSKWILSRGNLVKCFIQWLTVRCSHWSQAQMVELVHTHWRQRFTEPYWCFRPACLGGLHVLNLPPCRCHPQAGYHFQKKVYPIAKSSSRNLVSLKGIKVNVVPTQLGGKQSWWGWSLIWLTSDGKITLLSRLPIWNLLSLYFDCIL